MSPTTHRWLADLESMGLQARVEATHSPGPCDAIVKVYAERAVDPLRELPWQKMCAELGIEYRGTIANDFIAQVELYRYATSALKGMLT